MLNKGYKPALKGVKKRKYNIKSFITKDSKFSNSLIKEFKDDDLNKDINPVKK